ncbi:MAG: hypothetical protein ACLSAH_16125 [Bilophila wadsworthia]
MPVLAASDTYQPRLRGMRDDAKRLVLKTPPLFCASAAEPALRGTPRTILLMSRAAASARLPGTLTCARSAPRAGSRAGRLNAASSMPCGRTCLPAGTSPTSPAP